VKEQFAADPTMETRYRGEPQSLDDIIVSDLLERARVADFNRTIQQQKRIGAVSAF
jgi:hypothetical protein